MNSEYSVKSPAIVGNIDKIPNRREVCWIFPLQPLPPEGLDNEIPWPGPALSLFGLYDLYIKVQMFTLL